MKKDLNYYTRKLKINLWLTRLMYICTYISIGLIFYKPILAIILFLGFLLLSNTGYRYHKYLKQKSEQLLIEKVKMLYKLSKLIVTLQEQIGNEETKEDNT